jgi:hypothetical protein
VSGPQPVSRRADIRNQKEKRRRARPESDSEQTAAGAAGRRQRSDPPAAGSGRPGARTAEARTPDVQDGETG